MNQAPTNFCPRKGRRAGSAHPATPLLLTDSDSEDVQGPRVVEEAGDLDLLKQVLFSAQLLKDTVLCPHPELGRPGRIPHLGAIDRTHPHHHPSLLVGQLIEMMRVGLRLAHLLQATPRTEHGTFDLHRAPYSSSERGAPAGHLAPCAGSDAGQQQDCHHTHSDSFPESRHCPSLLLLRVCCYLCLIS